MERVTAYQLDARDRISFVSPEWLAFATENGWLNVQPATVLGRSIWGFLSGAEVKHLYELLFHRVREARRQAVVPLRCDSPTVRRFMQLTVAPLADGDLDLECRMLREETRVPVPLLDPEARRTSRWLTICSWCKRIRMDVKHWVEVDEAMAGSNLLGTVSPHLTHGICPDCELAMRSLISDVVPT